jgi:hypothetical protein
VSRGTLGAMLGYMFHRRDIAAAAEPDRLGQARTSPLANPSVPLQACCCPARPMFKVVMPPTETRPRPVDLWLCGHHYRASQAALKSAGAQIHPLDASADSAIPAGAAASVAH